MANEELNSPAVQAAVAEERRFGSIEGEIAQLATDNQHNHTAVMREIQQLVKHVGIQNGRVGKNEEAITEVNRKVDAFITETRAAAVVNKAYRDGRVDTMSFIDKGTMRITALASSLIGIYLGLQAVGIIG